MEALQDEPDPTVITKYLLECQETLTPQCISLLQTLPFQKSYVFTFVFQYQGFWYPASFLNSVLSVQRNFQADPSDVLLATIPKAGTTWLKAILFALLNRSKHSPNSSDHPLLSNNPHDVVPFLELNLYMNDQDPDLSGFTAPRLFSTHIPFSALPKSVMSSGCKIVYLCRNPKDTIISDWHFLNHLRPKEKDMMPLSEAVYAYCRGSSEYGPFWDHALEYWNASEEMSDKVLFLKYEEIKEQPYEQVKRLIDFLGCSGGGCGNFSEEMIEEILRLCSFNNLKKLEVNQSDGMNNSLGFQNHIFFRKGKVGDSSNYLTQEMIQRIDRITDDKFRGSMLKL